MNLHDVILDGRYKLIRKIGNGGMGTVYLAMNLNLGTYWAIKKVKKTDSKAHVIHSEIEILKKLNHTSLPRIIDVIESGDSYYIVEDYIEGSSLDIVIEKEGRIEESRIISWGIEICEVLAYLHNIRPHPVIYRDMKPSNIMLTPTGTLKLVDFGIAREYKDNTGNDTVYIGTRGYAAPEQYGSGQTDERSDIYSLGITLMHLVTGIGPRSPEFDIKNIEETVEISESFAEILIKCTQFDADKRFQTVKELICALESLTVSNNDNITQEKDSIHREGYRKIVLTVWDNTEFACELAYIAAKVTGYNVLFADMDLLSPKADLFLNLNKYPQSKQKSIYKRTGIDIVMEEASKNTFSPEQIKDACVKRKELPNLYLLTGSYSLEDYEYYEDNYFIKFIECAYRAFDLVIISVNKSIYDSFTVIALEKSDYNLIAVSADIDKIREFNRYLLFLDAKQNIPLKKSLFLAFEYDETFNLDKYSMTESTGGCYVGHISYDKNRRKCRNLKIPYVRRMNRVVYSDYITILRYFNIIPKASLFRKIQDFLYNLINSKKPDVRYPLRH